MPEHNFLPPFFCLSDVQQCAASLQTFLTGDDTPAANWTRGLKRKSLPWIMSEQHFKSKKKLQVFDTEGPTLERDLCLWCLPQSDCSCGGSFLMPRHVVTRSSLFLRLIYVVSRASQTPDFSSHPHRKTNTPQVHKTLCILKCMCYR